MNCQHCETFPIKNPYFLHPIYPSDKNTVQNLIVSRLPIHDKPLGKAAAHHFSKPGKMLRAKMAMHGADALQVNQTAAIRWAAAVEVLHNASLIHDDICDGDKQRRGNQAVWAKFGRNVALTLGDWLIALSFEFAAEAAEISNTPRLMKILSPTYVPNNRRRSHGIGMGW